MKNTGTLYKHKLLTFVSILALFWIIASCQKQDDIKPSIQLTHGLLLSYKVGDTISIAAEISDNENLKQVSIYIINYDNQRVTQPYVYNCSGKHFSLNAQYVIDNKHLESGEYYLVIEAKDEYNTGFKYLKMNITGIAPALKQILMVEADQTQTHIYEMMPEKKLLKTIPHPYQDLIYNAHDEQYIFLSAEGNIFGYQSKDFEEVWSDSELSFPSQTFYGKLSYHNDKTYVSTEKGDIRQYDKNGQKLWQANAQSSDASIYKYHFFDKDLLSINLPHDTEYPYIERFNPSTGASNQIYPTHFVPEQIVNVDAQLYLVVGNQYHTAKACSLSTLHHLVQVFKSWENAEVTDALRISKYLFLFAFNDKIVEYYLPNNEERKLVDLEQSIRFYYEKIHQNIYYLQGQKIYRLNYPAEEASLLYTNDKKIQDLVFVYNQ